MTPKKRCPRRVRAGASWRCRGKRLRKPSRLAQRHNPLRHVSKSSRGCEMHVDTIAWALNQAVKSEQRAVLAAMALGAAESNNGTTYCGDLTRIAAGYLIPLTDVVEAT